MIFLPYRITSWAKGDVEEDGRDEGNDQVMHDVLRHLHLPLLPPALSTNSELEDVDTLRTFSAQTAGDALW